MSVSGKPWSEACEQNRVPILQVIGPLFADRRKVLEIGSGTGQHAVYFAGRMPHLTWQPSDLSENHPGIRMWLDEARLPNVLPPLNLDVSRVWPPRFFDAVFSANTAHILSIPEVEAMIHGVANVLETGGLFVLYGPFHYGGAPTSRSNAEFDRWLRVRDPRSGVRDFEWLDEVAAGVGLSFVADHAMPANNRTLVWTHGPGD